MFTGGEQWSTGFFIGEENADADHPTQLLADAVRDAWEVFHESATSYIGNGYTFEQVKLASINADGHTDLENVVYSYPATAVAGAISGATLRLPPQCSLVATLTTERVRGLASKGRMYLPGITLSVDANGKLSTTQAGNVATNLQGFFNAISGSFDMPNKVILAAKGTGLLPALTAQNEPVTGIRVGDVIDTQRRRRNALVELYQVRSITA
jgi:hypothetical protein